MPNILKIALVLYSIFTILYLVIKKVRKAMKAKNNTEIQKGARIYERLRNIPLVGNSIGELKVRLYINSSQDEFVLRNRAVTIFLISLISTGVIFIALVKFYVTDLYTLCCALLGSIFIKNLVEDQFVGSDIKILGCFKEFINNIKYYYEKHYRRVDKALFEAAKVSDPNIAFHGMAIYNCVKSGKDEVNDYIEHCPNHFLKFLANLSFTIREYGDKDKNGKPCYVENLNFIMEQAQAEYNKKSKLKSRLRVGGIAAIFPSILPKFLEAWIRKYFPSIGFLFDSSIGYFARIGVLLICFACYYLIKKYQNDQQRNIDRLIVKDDFWEEKLLKIKLIKHIVELRAPKKDTRKYLKLDKLIQNSGSNLKVEWLILRKVISGVTVVVLFTGFFIGSHRANVNRIINDIDYGIGNVNYMIMTGKVADSTNEDQQKIATNDRKIIEEIRKFKGNKEEEKKEEFKQIEDSENNSEQSKIDIERISKKLDAINNEHIKWYDILVTVIASMILANIPVWYLYFKKSVREKDMQNETFQFETITIMLMNHSRVSLLIMLKQMEQFAHVFRDPIRKCISFYSRGHTEALIQLKNDVGFWPFQVLVEKLIMASEGIKISKAFDSLELEREFRKEDMKDAYNKQVMDSIAICDELSRIPMIAVVIVYMVIPITVFAFIGMRDVFNQLNNVDKF